MVQSTSTSDVGFGEYGNDEPYVLITADTHAGGSHAQYREYLEADDRAAFDEWRGGYRNPSQEHYGSKKLRNWDFEIRSRDQDSQGVVGEVIFPNTVPPFYRKSIVTAQPPRPEDYPRALAGIRAHNRWLADFCAEDPERRAGIGLILPNDLEEAVKDIEFIAKAGLRGGLLLPCHFSGSATQSFFSFMPVILTVTTSGRPSGGTNAFPRVFSSWPSATICFKTAFSATRL